MFSCRNCTRRAIRAVFGDVPELVAARRPRQPNDQSLRLHRPRFASTDAVLTNSPGEPYLNHAQLVHIRKHIVGTDEKEESFDKRRHQNLRKALERELVWLPDPVKLAIHVRNILGKDNPEKALELCRLASRDRNCVVSWNHCIDWHMKTGKSTEAIKIYNEMKKRGQFPDALTYTLITSGFARIIQQAVRPSVKEKACAQAVSIYHSMISPASRIQPTIIHTNAVLNACSHAGNMDSLWGIVGQIPDGGGNSADRVTYTTILNAIYMSAEADIGAHNENATSRSAQAVEEGRRVWQAVITRWRAGEVQIDEKLVFSMARILLLSTNIHDWDDVLSLAEQTMNLTRQVPRVGSEGRHIEHLPGQNSVQLKLSDPDREQAELLEHVPSLKVFSSTSPPGTTPSGALNRENRVGFVQPGNAILSALLSACKQMRLTKTSKAYWDLLVTEYGVEPDLNNFHAQLDLLRASRWSAAAVQSISERVKGQSPLNNMSWSKALATCLRDKHNTKALGYAKDIITLMETHSKNGQRNQPSMSALTTYLELAESTNDPGKIVDVLKHLDAFQSIIEDEVNAEQRKMRALERERSSQLREYTVAFLQTWIGTIHRIITREMIDKEQQAFWLKKRQELDRLLPLARGPLPGHRRARLLGARLGGHDHRRELPERTKDGGQDVVGGPHVTKSYRASGRPGAEEEAGKARQSVVPQQSAQPRKQVDRRRSIMQRSPGEEGVRVGRAEETVQNPKGRWRTRSRPMAKAASWSDVPSAGTS